jgi:hypothetical protein
MTRITITRDEAIDFLHQVDGMQGFILADSVVGRLAIAIRQALTIDGVSVEVNVIDYPDSAER